MKKILFALLSCVVSINLFGQLNAKTKEEVSSYKTVYTCGTLFHYGQICYSKQLQMYYLRGVTDNRFETHYATIFLGTNKRSAILTLRDLESLKETITYKDEYVVNDLTNSPNTTIFKAQGTMVFSTRGVAGSSYCLWRIDFNKACEAIREFDEK